MYRGAGEGRGGGGGEEGMQGEEGGVWGKGGRGTLTHAHTRTRTYTHPHSPLLLHFTDLGCNEHFFWRRRSGYISIDREDLQVSWRP